MKQEGSRGITLMNMVLCFCVITIHVTSIPLVALRPGSFWHIIIYVVNKLLCFSVPSFIFLSGFKLYSKYGDEIFDIKEFFAKRLKKIIVPYLVCVLIYFIYFFAKGWVSIRELPQHLLLGTLAAHFYYVIIAAQLYLLFPFLKNPFQKHTILVMVGSLICTVFFQQFCHFAYSDRFVGTYIFYFVLGMLFSKYRERAKNWKLWLFSFVAWCAVGAFHVSFCYFMLEGKLFYHYANILNMVYVLASIIVLYNLCSWLSGKWEGLFRFSQGFGRISYHVYLYHILLILIFQHHVFPRFDLSTGEQFMILIVAVYSAVFLYNYLSKMCCQRGKIQSREKSL